MCSCPSMESSLSLPVYMTWFLLLCHACPHIWVFSDDSSVLNMLLRITQKHPDGIGARVLLPFGGHSRLSISVC